MTNKETLTELPEWRRRLRTALIGGLGAIGAGVGIEVGKDIDSFVIGTLWLGGFGGALGALIGASKGIEDLLGLIFGGVIVTSLTTFIWTLVILFVFPFLSGDSLLVAASLGTVIGAVLGGGHFGVLPAGWFWPSGSDGGDDGGVGFF